MRRPYSAWREGLKFYVPPLVLGGVLTASFGLSLAGYVGMALAVFGLCVLAFFRDPPRRISGAVNEAVAPADGTIVGIEDLPQSPHYDGATRRISIFLSILDVHVNRSPIDGKVVALHYKPGEFLDARDATATDRNESNTVRMETAFGPITVRQISGLVARRIVCPAQVGDSLMKGERFGMIRFGSRTELYLPPNAEVTVKMGDKVRGGATVVARLHEKI